MGKYITASGISGLAFALLGLGVPIAFPDANPLYGMALIGLGAVFGVAAGTLWLSGRVGSPTHSAGPAFTGPTTVHFHNYEQLTDKLRISQVEAPPVAAAPSHSVVRGVLNAVETGHDIAKIEVKTGLAAMYVGYIIVAAGALASDRRLDFAIVGYNGSGEVVRVCDVNGRIKAGCGNLRDHVKLPTPLFQGVLNAEPWKEFVLQMRQDVSHEQAHEYLAALEKGSKVSLDLRQLNIVVSSTRNPEKKARLPLWDGVVLRRSDDIVSRRNTILSVESAVMAIKSGEPDVRVG